MKAGDERLEIGAQGPLVPDGRGGHGKGRAAPHPARHHPARSARNGAQRAKQAGIATVIGNHTFRGTGITAYLKNGGTLEKAREMANLLISASD